jgi:hypothetical protein
MATIQGLKINEAEYELENGEKAKLAVLLYAGEEDPKPILDWAVANYTEGSGGKYYELIDAELNCPWVRVILSNINDMKQITWAEAMREIKLNKLLDIK